MDTAQLLFSPSFNWLVITVLAVVAAFYVHFSYRALRGSLGSKLRWGFAAAKLFMVLLLFLCLAQPVASLERRLTGQGVVAVLVDGSVSMGVRDSLEGRSRVEAAMALLGEEGRLLKALKDDYSVSLLRFDEKLSELTEEGLEELPKTLVPQTALLSALSRLSKSEDASSLAAVVLLTDGRENASSGSWSSVENLSVPIFAVGIGTNFVSEKGFTDLAILSVDSPQTGYLNNNLSMTVSIGAFNVPEMYKFARLKLTLEGKEILSKDFKMPASGSIERVSLDFVPDTIGFHKYQLELSQLSEESVLEDNFRDVYIDVREPRLRVLYIEGVLRPEYGFIRTTLTQDPDVKITSMVKTRKDSFLLQGENVKIDLSKGLPDKAEDFKEFDVIVLGDIPASAFREYQLQYLRDWVEKGGGLIALGGHNAFSHGGWRESLLAQVLPVSMSSADLQVDDPLVVSVAPAGKTHPIFKGIEYDAKAQQDGKGTIGGCSAPNSVKSGAQVLLNGRDKNGKDYVLMAVHKFGSGRVAAFTADTTGKSHRELVGLGYDSPWEKFWSQSVRWLAGFDEIRKEKDVYLKLSMESRFAKVGNKAVVTTEVSDTKKKLSKVPEIKMTVVAPDGKEIALSHVLDNKTLSGRAEFSPQSVGLYTFRGELHIDGNLADTTEYLFLAGQPWLENSNLSLDEEALKLIARSTGGKYYNIVTAARIPDDIAVTRGKGVERVTLSLWNNPIVFLLLLALLCVEWYVRRRNQYL
ncbi:MAG: glutamine amidotransferase [Planctomycetota bacterium]